MSSKDQDHTIGSGGGDGGSEPDTAPSSAQPSSDGPSSTTDAVNKSADDEAEPRVAGEAEAENSQPPAADQTENEDQNGEPIAEGKPIKLYKSSRLKGYMTMLLSSIINYDAAYKSSDVISTSSAVPATEGQRAYAVSVALISLSLSAAVTLVHLDTITPLEKLWVKGFKPKSRVELAISIFMVIWWSVATGIQTSVRGIAGDGKGQYSLYFSCWVCCFTSFWVLERWWVAAGLASMKAFITSWPYRSPGWLCILFMGIFTLIWYLDLWKAHQHLDREEEEFLRSHFEDVPGIQWDLIVSLLVMTIVPAAVFVLAEICRETKPDGTNQEKNQHENLAEGFTLLALILCWIPAIIWVTVPKGSASLIGNAYFSSWLTVIFIAETGVWFVHDLRERIHQSLEQKEIEYREKQRQVIDKAQAIQRQKATEKAAAARTTKTEAAPPISVHEDLQEFEEGAVVDVDDDEEEEDDSTVGYMDALTDF